MATLQLATSVGRILSTLTRRLLFLLGVFAEKPKYIRHCSRDDRAVIQSRHYFDLALEIQRLELIGQSLRTGRPNRRVGFALHDQKRDVF